MDGHHRGHPTDPSPPARPRTIESARCAHSPATSHSFSQASHAPKQRPARLNLPNPIQCTTTPKKTATVGLGTLVDTAKATCGEADLPPTISRAIQRIMARRDGLFAQLMSPGQRQLLAEIIRCASWKKPAEAIYVSNTTLCVRMQVSVATVKRGLKALECGGWITREQQRSRQNKFIGSETILTSLAIDELGMRDPLPSLFFRGSELSHTNGIPGIQSSTKRHSSQHAGHEPFEETPGPQLPKSKAVGQEPSGVQHNEADQKINRTPSASDIEQQTGSNNSDEVEVLIEQRSIAINPSHDPDCWPALAPSSMRVLNASASTKCAGHGADADVAATVSARDNDLAMQSANQSNAKSQSFSSDKTPRKDIRQGGHQHTVHVDGINLPSVFLPLTKRLSAPQICRLMTDARRKNHRLEDITTLCEAAILSSRNPVAYVRKLIASNKDWAWIRNEGDKSAAQKAQSTVASEREKAAKNKFIQSHLNENFLSSDGSKIYRVGDVWCQSWWIEAGQVRSGNLALTEKFIDAVGSGRLRKIPQSDAEDLQAEWKSRASARSFCNPLRNQTTH